MESDVESSVKINNNDDHVNDHHHHYKNRTEDYFTKTYFMLRIRAKLKKNFKSKQNKVPIVMITTIRLVPVLLRLLLQPLPLL